MHLSRVLESEVMDDPVQASAYAKADFADVNRKVRRNPRPLGRGQGARMQIMQSTLEVGESPPFKAGFFNRGFVERFLTRFPGFDRGTVLDLGCGPCDIPIRLLREVPRCRVVAVDASGPMLAHGRRAVNRNDLAGRIDLVCARVPSMCVRPGKTFDALVSNSLLHHLPDPEAFWESVKRLVRLGAPLLVMDLARPESEDQAREIVRSAAAGEDTILKRDFFRSLLASFTPDEVAAQLEFAGLGHLEVRMVSDRHWAAAGRIP